MRVAAAAALLALTACSPKPAANPPAAKAEAAAPIEAPTPGAPGGLPDDRTPLEETAKDPKGAQGAATALETWFALREAGKRAEAADLRTDPTVDELAGYREVRGQVGRPGPMEGAAGSSFVEIPVSVYGRRANGSSFARSGKAVMRRVNDVPGATTAQLSWRVDRLELGAEVSR